MRNQSLSSIALDGAQHLNISYPTQGPLGADIFFRPCFQRVILFQSDKHMS